MKKIFKTAILILVFSALSIKAGAAVLDSQFLKEKIKKDVEKQIKTNLQDSSNTKGNIKVEIINLPYEQIETKEGKNGKVEIETKMNLRFFNPITIVKVNILVNGEIYKSFIVQAKINIYDKVWVAKGYIKRGDVLTNVALEEKDITYLPKTITGKDFNPYKYISGKNYKPEDVIDSNFIENIPAIVKDSPVSVIFKTPSVSITIQAVALDKGIIGDYIKVRSKDYKKEYMGKIISENLVLVNI
jgi:flagella basal body P-ring formation protein FlgA